MRHCGLTAKADSCQPLPRKLRVLSESAAWSGCLTPRRLHLLGVRNRRQRVYADSYHVPGLRNNPAESVLDPLRIVIRP